KLATLFDNTEKACAYLERYQREHPDSTQPIHDACLFNLPETGVWDIPSWRALVEQGSEKVMVLLPLAPAIQDGIDQTYPPIGFLKENIERDVRNKFEEKLRKKYAAQYNKK